MHIQFPNAVCVVCVFVQSLVLYLWYVDIFTGEMQPQYLFPLLGLLVVYLVSMKLSTRSTICKGKSYFGFTTRHVTMLALLALIFAIWFGMLLMNKDCLLPIQLVTVPFLICTLLGATAFVMHWAHNRDDPAIGVSILAALLLATQGVLVFIGTTDWAIDHEFPPWIIAIPSLIFLIASLVQSAIQLKSSWEETWLFRIKCICFVAIILDGIICVTGIAIYTYGYDMIWNRPEILLLATMALCVPVFFVTVYNSYEYDDEEQKGIEFVWTSMHREPSSRQEFRGGVLPLTQGVVPIHHSVGHNPYAQSDSTHAQYQYQPHSRQYQEPNMHLYTYQASQSYGQ